MASRECKWPFSRGGYAVESTVYDVESFLIQSLGYWWFGIVLCRLRVVRR